MVFVKATPALPSKTADSRTVALVYAAVLVIFSLTQLFWFEAFPQVFESFGVGLLFAPMLAAVIIVLEVAALPFLLRMWLSPAMRWVSMVSGWLVAVGWLKISILAVLYGTTATTVGFLGPEIPLIPGWWAVCFSIGLGILAAWASWGLWPGKRQA